MAVRLVVDFVDLGQRQWTCDRRVEAEEQRAEEVRHRAAAGLVGNWLSE